jgi:glycosyltransferase involved in cell wall biosynthesis
MPSTVEATPRVSVVLPTFNRRATLERATRSVLDQTYANLELIVVDDGSTDGTDGLVALLNDPRLRYLRLPGRSGPARARNAGIRESTGALIAFQDSDDEWLPEKLALQVAALQRAPATVGLMAGSYWLVGPEGRRLIRSDALIAGGDYDEDLLHGYTLVTPTWLVRREVLTQAGLFDESLPCVEDWDLAFRLDRICRFQAVGEPVLNKYGSPDSIFGDRAKRASGTAIVLTRHRDRWLQRPRIFAAYAAELGILQARLGDRAGALRYLGQAVKADPRTLRYWAVFAAAAVGWRWLSRVRAMVRRAGRRGATKD